MKYPIEPSKPYPPTEPQEFYPKQIPITLSWQGDMDLKTFLERLPDGVKPEDLRFSHTNCHCDSYYSSDFTEIYYIVQQRAPNYKSNMITYNKKIQSYEKDLAKYKLDYAQYLEDKKVYDVWAEEQELKNCKKRIKQLEKKRTKS